MTEELYCKGCGVKLQSNDPKMLGYIPDSAIEKGEFICKRCFRIKTIMKFYRLKLMRMIFTKFK